jgi:hypothetical protein
VLYRLGMRMGVDSMTACTSSAAADRIGLSQSEARGMMDGWDVAAGHQRCWTSSAGEPGYQEGFDLGSRLYVEDLRFLQPAA